MSSQVWSWLLGWKEKEKKGKLFFAKSLFLIRRLPYSHTSPTPQQQYERTYIHTDIHTYRFRNQGWLLVGRGLNQLLNPLLALIGVELSVDSWKQTVTDWIEIKDNEKGGKRKKKKQRNWNLKILEQPHLLGPPPQWTKILARILIQFLGLSTLILFYSIIFIWLIHGRAFPTL